MTQNAGVALSQIGQIAINVRDLDRATAFYRDVLGMTFLFTVPAMAFFQCGDVRVMLGEMEQPEHQHPASIVYYRVADIEVAHEALVARGVPSCSSRSWRTATIVTSSGWRSSTIRRRTRSR